MTITKSNINSIISNLEENDVSIIDAPTGSGKSTYIVEQIYNNGERSIMVGEQTVLTVKFLYDYMSEKFEKGIVGYAANSIINYSNSNFDKSNNITPIVYATYGHLKSKLLKLISSAKPYSNIKFVDVLMIDEAHLANQDLEMCLYLIKYGLIEKKLILPKIVLASGTINPKQTIFPDAKFHKIIQTGFERKIIYNPNIYLKDTDKYLIKLLLEDNQKMPSNKPST